MTMEVLAIIPARGGSRGLHRKNLAQVAGVSLVARAVNAAYAASLVSRVVGSTDSVDIATALVEAGAEVPWLRPVELATSDTPDSPVFLHALNRLAVDEAYTPTIVVNVRPTAPLRTGDDIDAALRLLLDHPGVPSVKSVSAVTEHPYKMWSVSPYDGSLSPLIPEWHHQFDGDPDVPRQRLPPVYRSNGAVDAVWVAALLETGRFHPGPVLAYKMDQARSLDVDSQEDLLVADERLGRTP